MIEVKFYNELPAEAAEIRKKVFIEEQGFQNEFDEFDNISVHAIISVDGIAAGTARMFTEDDGKSVHLGRIAVLKEQRKLHLGSLMLNALFKKAKELGAERAIVGAQCRAAGFYKSLGFTEYGEIYSDEGCPHIYMQKEL